jgi:hypothetical protein
MSIFFTISKPSGIKLNSAKTDFNTSHNHYAVFKTKQSAKEWIEKNDIDLLAL